MEFIYEGVNNSSKIIEGEVIANSEEEAIIKITDKGLNVVSIQKKSLWQSFNSSLKKSSIKIEGQEVGNFFNELASILKSGLTPLEAAEYMALSSEDSAKFQRIGHLAFNAMKDGATFSEGLRQAGISSKYCDVIAVGEKSGDIITALDSEVSQIELDEETKKGFRTIYVAPAVSGFFMLAATIASIIWLVPLQEKIIYSLATSKEEVPPISAAAFWIGDYGIQIIIGSVLFIILFLVFKSIGKKMSETIETFFDVMAMKIPVFGSFYRNSEYARISSMLMLSLSSGTQQEEVISLIKNQTNSIILRKKLNLAYKMIKDEGYLISQAFEEIEMNGLIIAHVKRGERAERDKAVEMMKELTFEFSKKTLYNMKILTGASEMINMIMLSILSIPILMISVAPSIDQVTLMMNRF